MPELDFNQNRSDLIEYVIARILEAESGDPQAINYIEFLWGADPELLDEAKEALFTGSQQI